MENEVHSPRERVLALEGDRGTYVYKAQKGVLTTLGHVHHLFGKTASSHETGNILGFVSYRNSAMDCFGIQKKQRDRRGREARWDGARGVVTRLGTKTDRRHLLEAVRS